MKFKEDLKIVPNVAMTTAYDIDTACKTDEMIPPFASTPPDMVDVRNHDVATGGERFYAEGVLRRATTSKETYLTGTTDALNGRFHH